ncbi:hypothetical protein [Uliginosibacterium sediminicola]|uniref:Secretin/TonB short N-terminal domain-containing protein n=1 Tax=Uliginosibacterium sediminicola TaxID=2024550 RepID=A0ABU9YXZ3_9RHOO
MLHTSRKAPGAGLPPRCRPLLAALLSAGLILPVQAAEPAARESAPAASAQRSYSIAAGPLAEVLNRFAAEAGIVLVFDAAQLKGLSSRGLVGRYDLAGGFRSLLAGTPFEAQPSASGGFVLRARPATAAQTDSSPPKQAEPQLPSVVVYAKPLPSVDSMDREMIRNLPAINGDITSQLKLNPNIQYSEGQLSSFTGGEIAPAEISIHGAKPYQNEMLIDGVSIANDLDPGNKITPTSPEFVPGAAQALAIDNSILCDVEVRDSNVSAEYGRFTGGVVDAKICAARKRLGGSVSVGYTSSDWTTLFVDDAKKAEFENSSSADYQPEFKKWTYKASVETRPREDWGLLLSVVRKQSDIPLNRFTTTNSGSTESHKVTQQRIQDTLVLKTDFAPAGSKHKGDVSVVYAPASSSYFIEDYRDSDYTIKSGGLNLSSRLESKYALATLSQQLSYSQTEQSRRSDADTYRNWRWSSDKNWGDATSGTNPTSGEGAWGDVDQRVQTINYKFKSAFKAIETAGIKHRFTSGIELSKQHAEYERLKDQTYYYTVANLPTTGAIARCQRSDGSYDTAACSATPTLRQGVGQYFRNQMIYHAGSFDVDAQSWAAYLEDESSWRNFILRGGLRLDRDSLTGDTNLAPRSRFNWQLSEPLNLELGANRYYGRNLFAYAMQEKVNTLKTTQTRNGTLTWGSVTSYKPLNRLEDIKTPFDDELSAGLSYDPNWLAGTMNLRFTRRDGRDQIVKRIKTGQADCNSNQCYIYTNDGGSLTKDVTLSWSSARAFKTGPAATRVWFAFNKSDVKSNYSTYADTYSTSQANDAIIKYDGEFIRYSEMPADNYNRPWTLRIGTLSSLPAHQLTISNILRIRDGYQQMLSNGTTDYQGTTVDVYEKTALPRSIALDTVFHWSPRVYRDQQLDIKLSIENITNRKNKISVSDTYATYERGRSFALEIGYVF